MSRSTPLAVKFCIFGLAVLFAVTTVAQAATIYVDHLLTSDCTSGEYSIANRDDSGSDGNAYDTIQEAHDVVNAGDTIYVRAGTYAERVMITRSGSSGNDWTLANYNGEEVWVDGEWNSVSNQRMYCLHIDGASYINIDGINCKRAFRVGIYSDLGAYIDVSNLTVTSSYGHGIGLYGDIASGGSHDWTFTNVKSYNNLSGVHLGTKSVDSAGDITFTDCEMTDGCGQGVTARWDGSSASFDAQTVPDRNHQTGLWAASDSTIYICGYGGFLMKTTDSGSNWSQETIPTREVCLNGIWGSSTSDIFAVGAHGVAWHYNGTSWSAMDAGTGKHLYAVSGASSSAVWAVGWNGTILKYNGTSWSPQTSGTTNHLRGVWAVDANTVYAVGFGGTILKTTNGGTNWSSLTTGTSSNLYAIEGSSSSVVWAVGASGTIRKTTDGGTNWSGQTSPYSRYLTSISVKDSNNVWVGGQSSDAQTLISTSNGGTSWSDQSGKVVWGTMGWPNNDVCVNGIKVHSNDEVTIACGEYNENADGIAATASHDMITLTNCKLNRNGDDGLDLYNCEDSFIDNCEIIDNDPSFSAAGDGNGIKQGVQDASDAICQWTLIAGNTRTGYDTPKGTSRLRNVTVYGNGFRGISACVEVHNVITWGNNNLDASLSSGTFSHIIYGDGTITGGTDLSTSDPDFIDAENYDFTLDSASPAVDAGTDLGFSYNGSGPDIGAYEYDPGAGNTAPSVGAGSDDECTLPSGVSLDGTVTDDGNPDPPGAFTVAWSKISGTGTVTFGDSSAIDTTATFSAADTYVLRLFADDDDLTAYDDVSITVNADPNTVPTVSAGSDDECTLPSGVTLDGTVSDDGLPNPPAAVTTTWSKTSGPGTVTFGDSAAVDTTAGFSTSGTYVLKLTADDSVLSNYDEVTITVNAATVNTAPTVSAGSDDECTLPSGVSLDGTVSDDGLPNPPAAVTVTWSKTSGPGTVTFGDSAAVDTTAGFSTDGTYVLRLTADDSVLTNYDEVTITVNAAPVNTVPTVDAGSDDECTLPSGITLDGTVSDDGLPNPPASVTTTWSKTSGPGTVTFGDSAAVDTTAGFSTDGTYVLRLTADDNDLSDYDEMTVTVNAAPPSGDGNFQESGGTVVMEAENWADNDTRTDPYSQNWSLETTDSGYVGSGYMKAPIDSPLENATWSNGCELGYDIDFTTAGTYHIWVRRYAANSGHNSIWVGVDGTQSGGTFDNSNTGLSPAVWTWITTAATDVYISAGTRTFQIRRRERLYDIDRIILTTDGGYTPTGNGPSESTRGSNTAPTANGGSDQSGITVAAGATLAGTASDDGLPASPGSITTTWTKVSGPGTVTFGDSTDVDSTVDFSAMGTYVLQLEADDGDLTDTDTVQIVVSSLMSDNFADNDITDWTVVSSSGWAASSGEATKTSNTGSLAAIEKGGFSVSSGIITLEFDIAVSGNWRPGNVGLVDADGDGIYLACYVGNGYVEIGAQNTDDNALTGTGGAVSDATCNPSSGITIKYEVNLGTGEVKGYVDDTLEHTETLDLTGVGAITDVVLQAKKNWHLDNVVVD